MKKVAIIGAYGKGFNLLNGQTVKTKIITDELEREYGAREIWRIDTYGKVNNVLSVLKCVWAFVCCKNLIMLPANNALKVLAPWLALWNRIFHRRLHYIVIGGWLDGYLNSYLTVEKALHSFYSIYVETQTMKNAIQKRGFENVIVLPNCKDLKILSKEEMVYSYAEPYKLVTFSRVMKQKGIEDAILAVIGANERIGRQVFQLTIYGQIDSGQTVWFKELTEKYNLSSADSSTVYGGLVPFDQSTEYLKQAFALAFPTYYEGEGFAGTLIDAFAAGVPVIASDWKYNSEIVRQGETGFIFPVHDVNALTQILIWAYEHKREWNEMKRKCTDEARNYLPNKVLKVLYKEIM